MQITEDEEQSVWTEEHEKLLKSAIGRNATLARAVHAYGEDYEDIVQEMRVAVWIELQRRYDANISKLSTFIYTVVRSRLIHWVSKLSRKRRRPDQPVMVVDDMETIEDLIDPSGMYSREEGVDPLTTVLNDEFWFTVRSALSAEFGEKDTDHFLNAMIYSEPLSPLNHYRKQRMRRATQHILTLYSKEVI